MDREKVYGAAERLPLVMLGLRKEDKLGWKCIRKNGIIIVVTFIRLCVF